MSVDNSRQLLLSIIVPVYNVATELNDLLSVFSQLERSSKFINTFEVIFVDDGSTDDSPNLLENFLANHSLIRVRVVSKKNGGLSDARNVGLEYSGGLFIWFIDSDDCFDSRLFDSVMMQLSSDNPVDLIQLNYKVFTGNAPISNPHSDKLTFLAIQPEQLFKKISTQEIGNFAWAHIVRRSIYFQEAIRFPEGQNFEDIATTFLILNASKRATVLNKPIYYYRIREGSITGIRSLKNLDSYFQALKLFAKKRKLLSFNPNDMTQFLLSYTGQLYASSYDMDPTEDLKAFRKKVRYWFLSLRLPATGIILIKKIGYKILFLVNFYYFSLKLRKRV